MTDEEALLAADQIVFHAEAVRAGLFSSALDVADTMQDAGIDPVIGSSAIMNGAAQFTAQLWQQMTMEAGIAPDVAREDFKEELLFFFDRSLSNHPKQETPT